MEGNSNSQAYTVRQDTILRIRSNFSRLEDGSVAKNLATKADNLNLDL